MLEERVKTEESLAQVVVSQAEEGRFPGVTGNWLRGFITRIYKYDTIIIVPPRSARRISAVYVREKRSESGVSCGLVMT